MLKSRYKIAIKIFKMFIKNYTRLEVKRRSKSLLEEHETNEKVTLNKSPC